MERGLREPALSQMELVFTRQKTIAEETSCALETAALVEVAPVRDEYVPNQVGMIEEEDVLSADPVMRDVAVVSRDRDEKGERITDHLD
jgi:hypothetical protein